MLYWFDAAAFVIEWGIILQMLARLLARLPVLMEQTTAKHTASTQEGCKDDKLTRPKFASVVGVVYYVHTYLLVLFCALIFSSSSRVYEH